MISFRTLLTAVLVLFALSGCSVRSGDPFCQNNCATLAANTAPGETRVLTGLTDNALGLGGGYLVGADQVKILQKKKDEALAASRNAEQHPATPGEVKRTDTGDLNHDGFVTLDEVLAMKQAGLGDDVILERLHKTNQIFELTPEQARYLADRCVGERVVKSMVGQPAVAQRVSAMLSR